MTTKSAKTKRPVRIVASDVAKKARTTSAKARQVIRKTTKRSEPKE